MEPKNNDVFEQTEVDYVLTDNKRSCFVFVCFLLFFFFCFLLFFCLFFLFFFVCFFSENLYMFVSGQMWQTKY